MKNFEAEKNSKQTLKEQEDREIDLKNRESESLEEINENNLSDSETENIENLILEDIDAGRPAVEEVECAEYDPSTEEFKKKGEFVSKNKNHIPHAIWKIKMKYALPGNKWKRLSQEDQMRLKKKVQKEIEKLYIKKPDQVNNQEKKRAA